MHGVFMVFACPSTSLSMGAALPEVCGTDTGSSEAPKKSRSRKNQLIPKIRRLFFTGELTRGRCQLRLRPLRDTNTNGKPGGSSGNPM